jgi:hypothetical protein
MKPLTLFFFLFLCAAITTVDAQEYSPNRWKETTRLNEHDEEVAYKDTVFMLTTDRNLFDIVIGGYAYRGTVDGDSLNVKKRTFQVISNEPDEVRLRFKNLTHVFTRELKDYVAADAEAFAEKNKIPDVPAKKVNTGKLNGVWLVYKKQVREGEEVDIKTVQYFKKLDIYRTPQKGAKGSLVTATNLVMKVKSIKGSTVHYVNTFNQNHTLKILRQTANEILLEDEQHMIYFLKKQ